VLVGNHGRLRIARVVGSTCGRSCTTLFATGGAEAGAVSVRVLSALRGCRWQASSSAVEPASFDQVHLVQLGACLRLNIGPLAQGHLACQLLLLALCGMRRLYGPVHTVFFSM
jgi:hypothetical protein